MKKTAILVAAFAAATLLGIAFVYGADREPGGQGGKLDAMALEQVLSRNDEAKLHAKQTSGVQAPAFTLKALDGETYTVGKANGRPTVVHFWASWCEACSVEAPTLKKLHETYQDRIDFYGVNVSSEEKMQSHITDFIRVNGWAFTNLLDTNKRASYLYELHALPTTFILGEDGEVLDTFHLTDPVEFEEKLLHAMEGR